MPYICSITYFLSKRFDHPTSSILHKTVYNKRIILYTGINIQFTVLKLTHLTEICVKIKKISTNRLRKNIKRTYYANIFFLKSIRNQNCPHLRHYSIVHIYNIIGENVVVLYTYFFRKSNEYLIKRTTKYFVD